MNNKDLHRKTGFNAPKDYFNTFENALFTKLGLDESETVIPKTTGFTTPETYFDDLENIVLAKATEQKTKVISLVNRKQLVYITSVAAVLIFGLFIFNPFKTDSLSFDDIEYATYEAYFDSEDLDISGKELADLYEVDSNDLDNMNFLSIENDHILDYLSEETTSDDYYDNEL